LYVHFLTSPVIVINGFGFVAGGNVFPPHPHNEKGSHRSPFSAANIPIDHLPSMTISEIMPIP
ncbi:hypothetical protein, partial [Mesorhizobium sp. M7A.F.Ca.CA.001.08.1.1]|uniref:hypothetical protein n=1 Tax=Mesorhizobium sp. M7A.F.Ca.CA.001.08.1.1 TaxID=2496691 RepID=UPI0019D1B544